MANTYARNDFPDMGAIRLGGFINYFLKSSNTYRHASSQMKETPFFISLVNGWHCSERFAMNLWMYVNLPYNSQNFFRFLGGCISNCFDFVWIEVFRCYNKSKELTTGFCQKRLHRIHFQLVLLHVVEYRFLIFKMGIIAPALGSQVIHHMTWLSSAPMS